MSNPTFDNINQLNEYLKDIYMKEGVVLTTKNSSQGIYYTIVCDRHGTYRSRTKEPSTKATGTRLMGCPFELRIKKNSNLKFEYKIVNPQHNHELHQNLAGHSIARQPNPEQARIIKNMSAAGVLPKNIVVALRQDNPETLIAARTVYQEKTKIKKETLKGRNPTHALLDLLKLQGYWYQYKVDRVSGMLTHLFFAHPGCIALARHYHFIFLMDCTYKTNKYITLI